MSRNAERCLLQHLTDRDSLAVLVDEGIPSEAVPTEQFRPVIDWAMSYYYENACELAPSPNAMKSEFGPDLFSDNDIDLEDAPEDSVEWAVSTLKANYLMHQAQVFVKGFASDIHNAGTSERLAVLHAAADDLANLSIGMARKSHQADLRTAFEARLQAYQQRKDSGNTVSGLAFGLPEADEHFGGIEPGELAVVAAGPKTGKSFFQAYVALSEWSKGRAAILFTLENSVEMTLDRIACLATGVNPIRWQRGEAHSTEEDRILEFYARVRESDTPLWIVQPEPTRRSVNHLVQEAVLRGADSLLIDQLTFIQPPDESAPRYLQIRDITHDLKTLISTSRKRMPCLLTHQVNREGVRESRKAGFLRMEYLAEGSEVERTADFVFGLHQSDDERIANLAKLQMLAARRTALSHWQLMWHIEEGAISINSQLVLDM